MSSGYPFGNPDGWALTCGHVAKQFAAERVLGRNANAFKNELSSLYGTKKQKLLVKELEKKYHYSKSALFELHNLFMNCVEGNSKIKIINHKEVDVALIKFEGYSRLLCDMFPVFPTDTSSLLPGKFLCRLGFPFPEFTNYEYDTDNDQIKWTDTGQRVTPRFPIEGMVTRFVLDAQGNHNGFELSTPGLRGQSGGPAFDIDGKIWGMQCKTAHHDLNFDVDQNVIRQGTEKRVTDSAFLHTGLCVHIDILKSFMTDNKVKFTEV